MVIVMKSNIISLFFLILLTGCTSKQLINNYQTPNNNGNYTLLPNGWKLTPSGENIGVGELPMNLVFTKDERYAITSNSGMGENTLSVIDLSDKKEIQRLVIDKTWRGIDFNDVQSILYVSGGNNDKIYTYTFRDGVLNRKDSLDLRSTNDMVISITGLTFWSAKNYIIAVSMRSNSIYFYDISKKQLVKKLNLGAECY